MTAAAITMPHRYRVHYAVGASLLEFEVELAKDGVIFYAGEAKLLSGKGADIARASDEVGAWLRSKFGRVDVDRFPRQAANWDLT